MDSYRRIPLSKPFEGARRISPELYMSGVASAFLGYQLGRTKSVDAFYRILEDHLISVRNVWRSPDYDASRVVCCFVKLESQAISVNHREIMRVLSSALGLEYREVRGTTSRNARIFDVLGPDYSVLAFLPLFSYTLISYDRITRRVIKNMRGDRFVKFAWRADFTSEFLRRIQEIVLNVLK